MTKQYNGVGEKTLQTEVLNISVWYICCGYRVLIFALVRYYDLKDCCAILEC